MYGRTQAYEASFAACAANEVKGIGYNRKNFTLPLK